MSAYRSPAQVEPTLTPEEEKMFLRAIRPKPWAAYLYFAFWTLVVVFEVIRIRTSH